MRNGVVHEPVLRVDSAVATVRVLVGCGESLVATHLFIRILYLARDDVHLLVIILVGGTSFFTALIHRGKMSHGGAVVGNLVFSEVDCALHQLIAGLVRTGFLETERLIGKLTRLVGLGKNPKRCSDTKLANPRG